MIVQFVSTKEIDLPEAPRGYVWRGSQSADVDIIALSGGPMVMSGSLAITHTEASAATIDHDLRYLTIGKFATPREAALALFAALGLEVQP